MLKLNVVHLDRRKIIFNNLYIIHDNFEKKIVARCVEYYFKRSTDWLAIFVRLGNVILRGLRMFTRLQQYAEAYFLPSNWVFNIITLKIKLLSPNSWFNPNLRGFLGVRFKVWMGGGAKSSPPPSPSSLSKTC